MRELIKEAIKERLLEHILKKYLGLKTSYGFIEDIVDKAKDLDDIYSYLEVQVVGGRNLGSDIPNIVDVCLEIKDYYGIDFIRWYHTGKYEASKWY